MSLENLDRGDIAFGLFLQVDEDAVDVGGAVVDVVVELRVVQQQSERGVGRVELLGGAVEIGRDVVDIVHRRVERHVFKIFRDHGERCGDLSEVLGKFLHVGHGTVGAVDKGGHTGHCGVEVLGRHFKIGHDVVEALH